MQPGSVYQMVYRLTLMSLLFMQCNRWMTDVKLTCLYNNHLCHLTPETWKSYGGGKKQYWAEFHFWASRLWEKDVGVTSNQISDTERAIKLVQPTLCPLSCVTDRLPRVISRPEWLRLLGFYYLPLCTWRAVGHPSWVRLRALCLKRQGEKKTHRPATYSVVIFRRQMVERITVSLKHVEQNSFGGPHFPDPSSSHRDPAMLGKITSTPNLPSLHQNGSASHWHCVVLTSNQLNLLLFV